MRGILETTLRDKRAAGRKLLIPYITGGLVGWQDAVRAIAASGADAIEIGLPFSDPVMDGPVIQQASQMALEGGATPVSILDEARGLDVGIREPRVKRKEGHLDGKSQKEAQERER